MKKRLFKLLLKICVCFVLIFSITQHAVYYRPSWFFRCPLLVSISTVSSGYMKQDDPSLIRYIQDYVLSPPSYEPYNLAKNNVTAFSHMYQTEKLMNVLFEGKKNGIFFEAGAFNGEDLSNTLYLEKYHSWRGLLVEASPINQRIIISKNRKAWLAKSCISAKDKPHKIRFIEAGPYGYMDGYSKEIRNNSYSCPGYIFVERVINFNGEATVEYQGKNCTKLKPVASEIQCFPLYSLLVASGMTSIDFMSLDVQGVEMRILKTLPFEKVNIKVLLIEKNRKTTSVKEAEEFIMSKGYIKLTNNKNMYKDLAFPMDMLFIKQGLSIPIS